MSERLTQVTIIRKDEWGDLQPGQMSPVKGSSQPLWIVCCPVCSCLGELRTHSVVEHEDGTVTVSPSLVCNGSLYRAPKTYDRCPAHYFIERNQIRWC
jgi:hypothetical protein